MHDDDEDEYLDMEEGEFDPAASREVHPFDFVIAVWCLLGSFVQVTAAFFDHVAALLVAHRNYKTNQRGFADSVRADLESIPTKED